MAYILISAFFVGCLSLLYAPIYQDWENDPYDDF
jgi:hypothetical protein